MGCLVAMGAAGPVLAIVLFLAIWQFLQPSERVVGRAVAIDGCEDAYLFAPGAGDAGRPAPSRSYRLVCRNEKEQPPTCEETFSRFVHARGAVPGPVHVVVDYQGQTQCDRRFDGTGAAR